MTVSHYPVHVEAHIDPGLSRWQWLFKWLLAIPHYVILAFLWMAFVVLSVIAFFAILFTGRYPRGIFDFNVGVLRWTWRVQYYSYGALGTDRYPPFSLEERADYPAHLEVEYPAHLSRGLVLVKWWLLAIPHYLVVGLFLGGATWAVGEASRNGDEWSTRGGSTGLIGLLVLFAGVALLFRGRYPRSIFDLVLGMNRWVLRVAAYAALMTDVYPPFRLDQGGDDPTVLHATAAPPMPTGPTPQPAPAAADAQSWPTDPASPTPAVRTSATAPTAPVATPTRPWTAGRVIALVVGCLVLLGSIGIGLAGGALGIADQTLRDDDGFLMSDTITLTTGTYAVTSTSVEIHADAPASFMPERLLGDVKVTAESSTPVFVGIARTTDADAYLADVEHATLTDFRGGDPVYDTTGTTAPAAAPTDTDIWVARSSGTGIQQVVWPVKNGDWTVVVMNADGSRRVSADVAGGATVPALDWLVPTLLVAAGLGLAASIALLVVALHGPRRNAWATT
jgi:hypothetical protein